MATWLKNQTARVTQIGHHGNANDVELAGPSSDAASDDDVSTPKPQVGELPPDAATRGGLGRHLGFWDVVFLIIGRIIGTGIFSTPSSITRGVGSPGAALILWTLGFLIAMAGLLVWIELGCMIPRSGGEKVYLEAMYKRPKLLATTVFAFQIILLGFSASGCIVFAQYILVAAGKTATEWEKRGIAIVVISFITLWHTFFPRAGVRGMNVLGMTKIVALLWIIITGWVVLGGGVSRIADPHANFHNAFAGTVSSGNAWATALFKVINSYAGYTNAAYFVNEIKNPVRTLKIAGPVALITCGVLYLFANISYYSAASTNQIVNSGQTVASLFMGNVFGVAAQKAISVLIALSAFGNVMSITFAQARVNQELAKEGVIPGARFWASTWPFGSPSSGLFLHFIPSFIVIVAIPFGDAYNFIQDLEGYPGSVINFFVVIGFFWLRYRHSELQRPFHCPWPVAAFFLLAQVFLMVAPFLYPPGGKGDTSLPYWLYPVVGIAVLLAGVAYWATWYKIMPAIGRYRLVPETRSLKDGTVYINYKREKQL